MVEDVVLGSAEYPVIVQDDNAPAPRKKTSSTVCRYYKRGTCKHGASGNKDGICPYAHPKYCRNFVVYGNRSPRGCKKGDRCNAFHPKMCASSLNDGACYNTSCKHRHLKNTKREMPINVSDSTMIHSNRNSNSTNIPDIRTVLTAPTPGFRQAKSGESDTFLDALKQLKEEMIATIDLKLKEMIKTDQYPPLPTHHPMQSYQTQYHPNPSNNPHNQFLPETRLVQQLPRQMHPMQYQ